MPQILIKLIEHLQADDAGMPELAALIAKDAAMTSKILTVANSSAYHRNPRTVGLEQSLVSLGTDMIKTLVISESVFQTFNSFPHSGSTDLRGFWKGSLTTAPGSTIRERMPRTSTKPTHEINDGKTTAQRGRQSWHTPASSLPLTESAGYRFLVENSVFRKVRALRATGLSHVTDVHWTRKEGSHIRSLQLNDNSVQ